MTRLLSLFGLMRVSEHKELTRLKTAALDTIAQSYCGEVKAATDWQAKFKQAVADLEKQAGEIATLNEEAEHLKAELWAATEQARDNAADAQKWRDRADRERQRGQNKRAGGAK